MAGAEPLNGVVIFFMWIIQSPSKALAYMQSGFSESAIKGSKAFFEKNDCAHKAYNVHKQTFMIKKNFFISASYFNFFLIFRQ